MSLGLAMTSDPASGRIMACGPTITRECKNINTYNGLCGQINSANRFSLYTPPTLRDCPIDVSDIAFLLDGSRSVNSGDFQFMKNFVISLIDSLKDRQTRFSITQYSTYPFTHSYFNTLELSGRWKDQINSIRQLQGGTYTAKAIKHVVTNVFSESRGSRKNSKKVLIVITDGESQDPENLKDATNSADRVGIIRFAIGVGNAFNKDSAKAELDTIGSTPPNTHVFRPSTFNALEGIKASLQESIFSIEGAHGKSLKMEMAQEGFSAAYVPEGFQMGSVGAYLWSGGFQGYSADGQPTFSQKRGIVDPDSYLGYSMAVAHTKDGPVTIVGAPRYHHRGIVFVYPKTSTKSLDVSKGQWVDPFPWQSQIGEYFGAEIVTMEVVPSTERYSQVVLIAAPLHMEENWEGRVYVCTLTASIVDCQFDEPVILRGQARERGRFGSSMAPLPDLDRDGFNDLAIGAPLENQGQGSVYIFHGDARGTINTRISQRIVGADVQPGLQFFGLSISQSSFDLSGDGLPDLAVGSKGTVVLLRSKPIVMVEAQVTFSPAQILLNTSDCTTPVDISAKVCFTSRSSVQTVQARINFTLSLDTTQKRAYFTPTVRVQSESFILQGSQGRPCFHYDVFIEPCPEDNLNELFNVLNFSFDGLPSDMLRPILDQQAQTTTYHLLGFQSTCVNAQCVDELRVSFNFSGSSTFRVGIDELLTVTASLSNLGEESYYSQVILTYPAELTFRIFHTLQGKVDCSSLDSVNGASLGRSTCLIYKPVLKTNTEAVFTVSYGISANSQLSRKIRITANATSGSKHSEQSELFQTKEIDVKYSIFLSIASSPSYVNFTSGRSDLHKPVVNQVQVLNQVRAFNVTVVIRVPVRLGDQHIWQEREDLKIPECRRDGEEKPANPDFLMEIQQNLTVDCSVASCLVFRCNMFMGREQSSTFTIAANLSSGWIAQIGLRSAKFLLTSTATLEYNEDEYIFYSPETKHAPPIRKIVTEVEVYPVADFTKEIFGGIIGGLLLLAIITAGLFKAGFFKSQYIQMMEEAGNSGEGGNDGGDDGGEVGEALMQI